MNADRTGVRQLTDTGTHSRTRTATNATIVQGVLHRRRKQLARWWLRARPVGAHYAELVAQTVTPLGGLAMLLAVIGVVAGVVFSWVEAWVLAVFSLCVLAFAVPFLFGSRAYRTVLGVSQPAVVVGDQVHITVGVHNTAARPQLPALIELPVGDALHELAVPVLGADKHKLLQVTVPTLRRGVIKIGPLTVARQDPLGLLRREVIWPETFDLYVHPRTVWLPRNSAGLVRDLEGQANRRITDSDLSFHAVREYVPGDSRRHIHWRSTAKTGNLMVRQYEESQTARFAVLFDARREEYADDDEFEFALSVAASISVQAVRDGRERFIASAWSPGRVRPSVDGVEELPARTPTQLLNAWAELEPAPFGARIETLAQSLARSPRRLSLVALVTGSVPDVQRLRLAAVAFSSQTQVLAVRAALLADPAVQRIDGLTIATVGVVDDLPQLIIRGVL